MLELLHKSTVARSYDTGGWMAGFVNSVDMAAELDACWPLLATARAACLPAVKDGIAEVDQAVQVEWLLRHGPREPRAIFTAVSGR